ncbi:MAG TPA: uroporphyrinogen decarboxylase family protein [Terriglobia bacterium]|nr:uroporphyrinogen decarboxylase family protein [Terriglobia bacterium]
MRIWNGMSYFTAPPQVKIGEECFNPMQHDYTRILKTIRHEEPDRVPLMDFGVDTPIKDLFMGRPIRAVEDQVAFQAAAGFDFIYLRANYDFPGAPPSVSTGTPRAWEAEPESETISTSHMGLVKDAGDLEKLIWPDPRTVDATTLERAAAVLPPGMGIITGVGGVFTRTWMLFGYEPFCMLLVDNPELVERAAKRVGEIQCAVLRRLITQRAVVAVWYGDDLAYSEALMASPHVLRQYFFPWIEELAGIAHQAGLPFIMHSDGRLWEVLDDLITLGVEALNPIEPKAMDIYQLKRKYGDHLALFGNIDLGYTRIPGTGRPDNVRAEVRQRIKDLAPGGGYGVSSGAGVTRYVPLENFNAMREATFEYGRYPIRL